MADNGANLVEKLLRYFVAAIDRFSQIGMDFGAASLARNLDMPAIIIATGAAAGVTFAWVRRRSSVS